MLSCVGLFAAPWTMNSPGQNTGLGSLSLLQGICPTQGSNPGLPHCRWILSQLSHKENPRILEWVAYPFSSGSSQPKDLEIRLQIPLYSFSCVTLNSFSFRLFLTFFTLNDGKLWTWWVSLLWVIFQVAIHLNYTQFMIVSVQNVSWIWFWSQSNLNHFLVRSRFLPGFYSKTEKSKCFWSFKFSVGHHVPCVQLSRFRKNMWAFLIS